MSKTSVFCSLCQRHTDHVLLHHRESQGDRQCQSSAQVLACGQCRSESFRVVRRPLLEESASSG